MGSLTASIKNTGWVGQPLPRLHNVQPAELQSILQKLSWPVTGHHSTRSVSSVRVVTRHSHLQLSMNTRHNSTVGLVTRLYSIQTSTQLISTEVSSLRRTS